MFRPMNMFLICIAAATAIVGAPCLTAAAEQATEEPVKPAIELGAPFTSNAILQRQMPVPIWGWSKPGSTVTVRFAGQQKSAVAAKDGKWVVTLDPLQASATPRTLVITESPGTSVTLENVLVGEVWMASGQSNMQWTAGKSSVRLLIRQIEDKAQATGAALPPIRECKVTNVFSSLHPIERAEGQWSDGSDFSGCSAIAFAFAYELHRELDVPIGILNCAFSTTQIEAWVPRVGFRDGEDEYTKSVYLKILESDPTTPEHKAAWAQYYQELENTIRENAERVKNGEEPIPVSTRTPGNLNGNRDASWMYNGKIHPMVPYAIRGAIWNQGYANMGAGLTYYDNLHSLVRGWRLVWNRPDLPVYFHQFYCPGDPTESYPTTDSTAEMRLGAWLASKDIPNAAMASQIDICGAVHYGNKAVPGQRLARHALKNQYGKDIVADGPMFKSYKVEGDKLIVQFDHADGGLVVAETATNSDPRNKQGTGFANPAVVKDGAKQLKLFYIADEDRVWHQGDVKIHGDQVVLTAPGVKLPRGVSYAASGVGKLPGLYNRALLPATPFIFYDHKLVTKENSPDDPLKIAGLTPDPSEGGKQYEYRKMPLLSTQFRDNAVLQANQPVTIWGSAVHDWGYEAEGDAVIKFSFAGISKTIPVKPGMREWQVTVPPMPASAQPKTLRVSFYIDGELVHERVCEGVVIGDVWYVAAPPVSAAPSSASAPAGLVRIMTRRAKRSSFPRSSRYSVCVSTTPENRFASEWVNADAEKIPNDGSGLAAYIGSRIYTHCKRPVGVIYMESDEVDVKSWIPFECLQYAPSLMADYQDLAAMYPGNKYYDANVRQYIAHWKRYWNEYVPQLMATKQQPDNSAEIGAIPSLTSSITSEASQTYNVMVHSFTPASFKGVIFLAGPTMVADDDGANYGQEVTALANGWKKRFGDEDIRFIYTVPSKQLSPKITRPHSIAGPSFAVQMQRWLFADRRDEAAQSAIQKEISRIVDEALRWAYE